MNRNTSLPLAAIALGLTACGFAEPAGQAPPPIGFGFAGQPAAPDQIVKQFEHQYGPQLRQLYRSELHFMRVVCQPTKQQFEKIAAGGDDVVKTLISQSAYGLFGGPSDHEFDPCAFVANAIAKSVRATLSSELAARYQKELDERAAARKRVIVQSLVTGLDKVLFLTPEQRTKLAELLISHWDNSWNHSSWLLYVDMYYPTMPDAQIYPILTEAQKAVWRGINTRGSVRFGMDLSVVQGIEVPDEVWDDPPKPRPAGGKAADQAKGGSKAGGMR